jgi:hypothetical protein
MRFIYFLLGAVIPLPVFCDLRTGEILIQRASLDNYLYSFGIPVPIGFFAIVLLGMAAVVGQLLKRDGLKSINVELALAVIVAVGFVSYAFNSLDFLRILSLIFPFAALLFVYLYQKSHTLLRFSLLGYVASLFTLVLSHAVSIVVFENAGVENKILLFSSYFGYTIYQSLVAYSAVLSFLGCTLIVQFFMPVSTTRKVGYFLVLAATFFVLGYGARKSVLLDIFILFCSYGLFCLLALCRRFTIPKSYLKAALFIFALVGYLVINSGFSERALTYDVAVAQRGGAYQEFWYAISTATISDLLFGFGGGWGGYSNIFVEFVIRIGLLGMILFGLSLLMLARFVGRELFVQFISCRDGASNRGLRVWFVFLILSIVASNSVNMNLQLPYYVINLAFISLAFFKFVGALSVKDQPRDIQPNVACA